MSVLKLDKESMDLPKKGRKDVIVIFLLIRCLFPKLILNIL